MRPALMSLSILALAACQGEPPAQDRPPDTGQACAADRLQDHIGQPLSALDRSTLPDATRIIGPDMGVTMDYNPNRLNIEYDRNRIILRIACG